MKEERYCENLSINGIVSYCAVIAERSQTLFEADIHIPQTIKINEYEFATVISNLLENAVLAAAQVMPIQKRHVKISVHMIKDQIIVEIDNTFDGILTIDEKTGLPFAVPEDGHGYGMKSVQTFSTKHDAIFDFSSKDHKAIMRLLVPNK